MKKVVVYLSRSRFPVKLTYCIDFRIAPSGCCLRKSIIIISCYNFLKNYNLVGNQLCNYHLDQL